MAAEFDPLAQQVKPRTLFPLKFEEVLIAAGMAAIALITAANVVVRYLTNISFAFTEEYSVVLMVLVTILGTSLAMSGGRHIRIEYFTYLLSRRGRQIAEIIAMALVILPDQPAIFFTSGSEGMPKGVVLSHANIKANRHQAAARIDLQRPGHRLQRHADVSCLGLTGGTSCRACRGCGPFSIPRRCTYKIVPETCL